MSKLAPGQEHGRERQATRQHLVQLCKIGIDAVVLSAAIWGAFALRFDADIPPNYIKRLVFLWPYVVTTQMLALVLAGAPLFAWRYVGLREATRILYAVGGAAGIFCFMRITGEAAMPLTGYAQYAMLPFGVILIDLMLAFLGICGIRFAWRSLSEKIGTGNYQGETRKRTLLVGAGQAGLLMAKELSQKRNLGIEAIGFVDDERSKHGQVIHGLKVFGGVEDIPDLARTHELGQAFITISDTRGETIRRVRDRCTTAGIEAKLIPGLYEIASGKVNLDRTRPITIEDLLRRDPVRLEGNAVQMAVSGRCVLVTGAGGSIGLGICRQVLQREPRLLLMIDRAEGSLFEAQQSLLAEFPSMAKRVIPLIADVGDQPRIESILTEFIPSLLLHAAAHKHVPMMEQNPAEAIKNNIVGTRVLADAAHRHGVERFVMVSTDKAVNPSSVMGCTKRIAEMYVQSLSVESPTRFVTVRFGNVLASAGSVVPIFQKQINAGGPITVTHPEMKRYFMTIPEACQLVLEAGSIGEGGEIFILDMGEPVKIVDLAEDMIRLSGLTPGKDIEIQFSGTRPGEKLFEELSVSEEVAESTRHPQIFVGRFRPIGRAEVTRKIESLRAACDSEKPDELRERLASIVPEYSGRFASRDAQRVQAAKPPTQ